MLRDLELKVQIFLNLPSLHNLQNKFPETEVGKEREEREGEEGQEEGGEKKIIYRYNYILRLVDSFLA